MFSGSYGPCGLPEQQRAEDLTQVSGAQLVSGPMQTQAGQVSDHAEQGQTVLGGAGGRTGHAPQHLSAVLWVSSLCRQKRNMNKLDQQVISEPGLVSTDPGLRGSCQPAARRAGRDRGDPAGTGPPRHTGTAPPAAPGLKTNAPQFNVQRPNEVQVMS